MNDPKCKGMPDESDMVLKLSDEMQCEMELAVKPIMQKYFNKYSTRKSAVIRAGAVVLAKSSVELIAALYFPRPNDCVSEARRMFEASLLSTLELLQSLFQSSPINDSILLDAMKNKSSKGLN